MRYLKTLGLAILAMAALASFTGSASATTLTSPAGTTLGAGARIQATAHPFNIDGLINATCLRSGFEGEVENAGGEASTVRIKLFSMFIVVCGAGDTPQVLKPGTLEIHTDSIDGNGVVTWDGGEFTIQLHRKIFGFPITSHCIVYAENTPVGTLTGSKNREGKTAVLDFNAVLPLKATDLACGEEALTLTGSYAIETPDYLDVD